MRSTRRRILILKQLYITMLCNIRLQRRIQNVLISAYILYDSLFPEQGLGTHCFYSVSYYSPVLFFLSGNVLRNYTRDLYETFFYVYHL